MGRAGQAVLFVFLLVLSGALLAASPAGAAMRCEDAVLSDWSDNGRIDRLYPLHCYDKALEVMPADLRDYTNAAEVIQRALASATNRNRSSGDGKPARVAVGVNGPDVDPSRSSAFPIPLVLLGSVSGLVLAAGGLGYLARRRRPADDTLD